MMRSLLELNLLHDDVDTVAGPGLEHYLGEAIEMDGGVEYRSSEKQSTNTSILAHSSEPFAKNGGLRLLSGNVGRAIIKVSAVVEDHQTVDGTARVFDSQHDAVDWGANCCSR